MKAPRPSPSPSAQGRANGRRWRYWMACLATLAATAALCTNAWLYRGNTLHRNGRWVSGKVELARAVMGAVAFLTTRTALSRNRLNLGAWHGFQEVLHREPLDAAEVSFDFRLSPSAYLTFEHHRDERGFAGVRFSANPSYPPSLLTAVVAGNFLGKAPLAQPSTVADGGWHRARVVFHDDSDGHLDVSVDGAPIGSASGPPATEQRLGFRAGLEPVHVDNVEIRRRGGAVLYEDFANRRGWPVGLLVASLLVLLFDLLVHRVRGGVAVVYYNLLLCAGALLFHGLDWFHFSGLHPGVIRDWGGYTSTIEDRPTILARLEKEHGAPSGKRRILFVGSSQTWGAGASRLDQTYVARLQAALGPDVECINTGISGERATALVAMLRHSWLPRLRPALVVVDLASNDEDEARFRQALEELADLDAAHHVPTLLVLEPNSPETEGSTTFHQHPGSRRAGETAPLPRKHAVMREVAARHHLPLVDLTQELTPRRDDGFLWWDFVHLTSYGHQLAADRLLPAIRPLLGPEKPPAVVAP